MTLNFTKMHGLGNDFILFDAYIEEIDIQDWPALAVRLCNRNFGIGADGIILVEKSTEAMAKMRIFNADGTEPEMCGNGIRCFARYLYEHHDLGKDVISVETKAGIMLPAVIVEDGQVRLVEVDMGEPHLKRKEIPMEGSPNDQAVINEKLTIDSQDFFITAVSMGNPHAVIFRDKVHEAPIVKWGPQIENHAVFPQKTNVEFAQIVDRDNIIMRVWERGVGETLACGTGACATVVAAVQNTLTNRRVNVQLAGGTLHIEWLEDNHVSMTGPAIEVFQGTIPLSDKR